MSTTYAASHSRNVTRTSATSQTIAIPSRAAPAATAAAIGRSSRAASGGSRIVSIATPAKKKPSDVPVAAPQTAIAITQVTQGKAVADQSVFPNGTFWDILGHCPQGVCKSYSIVKEQNASLYIYMARCAPVRTGAQRTTYKRVFKRFESRNFDS